MSDLDAIVANLRSRGMKVPDPAPLQGNFRPRSYGWPWPYLILSNGFEVELNEWLIVKSLIDAEGYPSSNGKTPKIKVGERCAIRHSTPGQFELVKQGRGNRRFITIKGNVEEGTDFSLIKSEKINDPNNIARKLIGQYDPAAMRLRTLNEIS